MELGPHLANQDVAGDHFLATKFLDAPPLRVRIATVAAGALTFFMCHGNASETLFCERPCDSLRRPGLAQGLLGGGGKPPF